MIYKAEFLWGFEDDSIESLGYEFANANTESYRKECWDSLVQKIKQSKDEDIAELKGTLEKANAYMNHLEENWTCRKSVEEIARLKEGLDAAREDEVVAVLEWYDKLSPAEKCTVWPPAGSGGSFGIYTLSYKQLYQLYLKHKKQ